mmetsp:Transcript_141551/g.440036  ORF Transcript_141551/g.440036 Transcript_141551/m.440036 type:complete len:303 (+) Transcript_141551:372-1280(+)
MGGVVWGIDVERNAIQLEGVLIDCALKKFAQYFVELPQMNRVRLVVTGHPLEVFKVIWCARVVVGALADVVDLFETLQRLLLFLCEQHNDNLPEAAAVIGDIHRVPADDDVAVLFAVGQFGDESLVSFAVRVLVLLSNFGVRLLHLVNADDSSAELMRLQGVGFLIRRPKIPEELLLGDPITHWGGRTLGTDNHLDIRDLHQSMDTGGRLRFVRPSEEGVRILGVDVGPHNLNSPGCRERVQQLRGQSLHNLVVQVYTPQRIECALQDSILQEVWRELYRTQLPAIGVLIQPLQEDGVGALE